MTLAYNNKSTSGHGTDGQTDRQMDGQSATQYAAPSYGGGRRIINVLKTYQFKSHCKGDSHSPKTANIILPGLMIKQR